MRKIFFNFYIIPVTLIFFSWGILSKEKVDFTYYSTSGLDLFYDVPLDIGMLNPEENEGNLIHFYPYPGKSYMGFREALAFRESRGDYSVISIYGYMGKYQFGKTTLDMIGIDDPNLFLNTPILQEAAFKAYTSRNKWVLQRDIKRYAGTYVDNVLVTESGILAAAHLAGPGNVKKFLRSGGGDVFEDANGVSVKNYLRKFSGYDTSHIVPDKHAKAKIKKFRL